MAVHVLNQQFENASCGQIVSQRRLTSFKPVDQGARGQLALSVASNDADRAAAQSLLNKRYEWRGYGSSHKINHGEYHTTFLASLGQRVAGTITLAVDSAEGLAIDNLFKSEIDQFRSNPGTQVCELTKFAFEKDDGGENNSLLACLFHAVFLYGMENYDCTDLFIEVNPRHRRFYEAMLGFKPIGELRMNPKVEAPSQLMWISVSDVAKQITAFRSTPEKPSRSLYALFLSEAEEAVVKSRFALRREHGNLTRIFERQNSSRTLDRVLASL